MMPIDFLIIQFNTVYVLTIQTQFPLQGSTLTYQGIYIHKHIHLLGPTVERNNW